MRHRQPHGFSYKIFNQLPPQPGQDLEKQVSRRLDTRLGTAHTPACHYSKRKKKGSVGPAFYAHAQRGRRRARVSANQRPSGPPSHPERTWGRPENAETHVLELSDPPQLRVGDTCRHLVGKHGCQPSPLWECKGAAEGAHAGPFPEGLHTSAQPPLVRRGPRGRAKAGTP